MKIALLLMPWYRRESPPPEFAMTVAILRNFNHEILVYDINNRVFNDEFFLRTYWKYFLLDAPLDAEKEFFNSAGKVFRRYAEEILSAKPDAVIFKIIGRTYANSLKMAEIFKEKDKDKKIIFSGISPYPREIVNEFVIKQNELPMDYIICGEDDVALPELIKRMEGKPSAGFNQMGKVIDCTDGPVVKGLDELPHYDFSDFNLSSYKFFEKLEIFISRGCPWHCNYCIDWITEKRYRSMSGERIFREVQYQTGLYKTKHFRFCDKTINGNIKAIDEFCELMLKAYPGGVSPVHWSGDGMIDSGMTRELLLKMYRAGCRGIGYGVESGSDKVIKDMDKKFSPSLAAEVIRNTHEAGIFTSINIMVGFPTEAAGDFSQTMDFISANKEWIDEIRLTYTGCRILKGSALHSRPDKFNLADTDSDRWITKDGLNTYDERVARYEKVCQYILDLGIDLRVNSRPTKKVVKAG